MHPLRIALSLLIIALTGQMTIAQEVLIDASHHVLGESLRAVVRLPVGATAEAPAPVCIVVHGSGGLFKENLPGESCSNDLEDNFQGLFDLLEGLGVASVAPSSFASREARFCEDNDDNYLQFAPAPFFNVGDGAPKRDDFYKIRRVIIRTLDLLAATRYACSLAEVDCDKLCFVGASNGGTTMMSYLANNLSRHLVEFTDPSTMREHESNASFADRQIALQNFPSLPLSLGSQIAGRTLPRFVHAISPGCSLRELVPTIAPDDVDFDPILHLNDLYYPQAPTELQLEIGTADNVPDACYNGGIRQLQAEAFETLSGIASSRYLVTTHWAAGYDLLVEVGPSVHARLTALVLLHFFPIIFGDGFESAP